MKPELAEKIRSNLITQALIVVLCVTFSTNRSGQTQDMADLETLYVSQRLLAATTGDVRNNDRDVRSELTPMLESDLERYMTKDRNVPEVIALAQFLSKAKPAYDLPLRRLPLPSGGWLRFKADRRSYKELAAPSGAAGLLFELTIVTDADSDLHQSQPLRITITNAEQSTHPVSRSSVWEPMHLRAVVKGQDEPMGAADIESLIRLKARSWTNGTGTSDSLYAAARYSYENEEITIPVVNMQVSASLALAALALISTALSAFASYQCRTSGAGGSSESHHGILILRPDAGTVPGGWWHHLLAQIEILFVQPPYWIGLLAPIICSALLAIAHSDITGWWLGWLLLPFGVSYTVLLAKAIVGVAWGRGAAAPVVG